MRALKGRLEKLEGTTTVRSRDPRAATEAEIRIGEALQELYSDAPQQVEVEVSEWVTANLGYRRQEASTLVYAVLSCVWNHLDRGTPLAMPTEVADVYSRFPEARPLHECEECGYAVPFEQARPLSVPPAPERVFFERCPLCGGRVGWWAHGMKRSRDVQAAEA